MKSRSLRRCYRPLPVLAMTPLPPIARNRRLTPARALPRLFCGAAALLATASPAAAQAPAAPPPPGLHLTLDYDGRLILKVLELRVQQDAADKAFTSSARLTTYGVLALFRKLDMRAEGKGRLTDAGPLPATFGNFNASNKKPRHVTATWTGADVVTASNPQYPSMGDPPANKAQKLEAFDPLTQAMRIALTPSDANPCRGVLKFFDGKQRYDAALSLDGARELEGREKRIGLTAPVKCRLQYREVAGFKKKPEADQGEGLKKHVGVGFARIGAAGPWVISYARADTQLGQAEIALQKISGQAVRP